MDMSSFDLQTVGALASIAGLLPSFVSWFTSEYHARRAKKKVETKDIIEQYVEWLRRQRHNELLTELHGSQQALSELHNLVKQLMARSRAEQEVVLAHLKSMDAGLHKKLDLIGGRIDHIDGQLSCGPRLEADDYEYNRAEAWANPYLYRYRRVRFVGRDEELKQLRSFLAGGEESTRHFRWALLTGPGGSGKSRLALELCLEVQEKWYAGFLSSDQDFGEWTGWRPTRPTLIVVDYAGSRIKEIGIAISKLHDERKTFKHPVRMLLLEREVISDREGELTAEVQAEGEGLGGRKHKRGRRGAGPTEFDRNWIDGLAQGSDSLRAAVGNCMYQFRGGGRLRLERLGDDWIWDVICDIVRQRGKPTPRDKDEIIEMLKDADPEGRPLFAAFAGEALAEGHNVRQWDKGQLADFVLKREKERWRRERMGDKEINLLALSTMMGGISEDSGGEEGGGIFEDPELRGVIPNRVELDSEKYGIMAGVEVTEQIPPLEPDILGECFVLERFRDINSVDFMRRGKTERLLEKLRQAAWKHDGWSMGWFIRRTADDFPNDPVLYQLCQVVDISEGVRHCWADTAADLISTYGRTREGLETARELYEKVKGFGGKYPEESELPAEQSRAGASLVQCYADAQQTKEAAEIYGELGQLMRENKKDRSLLRHYTEAGVSMIEMYGEVGRTEAARSVYDELCKCAEGCTKGAEDDLFVGAPAEELSEAALEMVLCYEKSGRAKEGAEIYECLRQLVIDNREDMELWSDLPENQALAAMRMASCWARAGEEVKAEEFCREVSGVIKEYKIEPYAGYFYNWWGIALSDVGRKKEGEQREGPFREAIEKYEKAIEIDSKDKDSYCNWGAALGELAKSKEGVEREELVREEIAKYEKAIEIDSKHKDSYYNWGVALGELAKSREGTERGELVREEIEKYEKAIEIDSKDKDSYYNWAYALMLLALRKSGREREELLEEAEEKCRRCEEIEKYDAAHNIAGIWALRGDKDKCREWLKRGEQAGTLESREDAMVDECLEVVREEEWFGKIRWKGE